MITLAGVLFFLALGLILAAIEWYAPVRACRHSSRARLRAEVR